MKLETTAFRVLYLTHRVPYPPDKGDRIRNYHVLRQLAAHARVWLIALADEPVAPESYAALNGLCERVAILPAGRFTRLLRGGLSALTGRSLTEGAFHEPAVDGVIRDWLTQTRFDAAVVSASGLVSYLRRNGLEQVPSFVDLVDVDSQKWLDFAASTAGPKRWLYRFEGHRLRRCERELPSWATAVSLVSEAEAKVYESFAGPNTATVATNGVDLDYFRPTSESTEEPACVFVGALDYLPNVDAAIWFAETVWPAVHAQYPQAEFRIVGRSPTASVRRLANRPGVRVIGSVPDVRPHVAQAAVAVVPMRLSRGLQNKVLEALAMSKAVIAAPAALAALRTEPGRHLLAAHTSEEWIATLMELFMSPMRRKELGEAGRRFVEEHHHWDRCLRPLIDRIIPMAVQTRRPECHHA